VPALLRFHDVEVAFDVQAVLPLLIEHDAEALSNRITDRWRPTGSVDGNRLGVERFVREGCEEVSGQCGSAAPKFKHRVE
jgi:hypothetical protein